MPSDNAPYYAAPGGKSLPVGTRVMVTQGHWGGQPGVIVTVTSVLLNGHDCAVLLDPVRFGPGETQWPLCFYWHELVAES